MWKLCKKSVRLFLPVAGVFALGGAVLTPFNPATAAPLPDCVGMATCTEEFDGTGSPVLWTVPDDVTELTLEVAAASGGEYLGLGGAGGDVTGTVSVDPGDTLVLMVGERGQDSYPDGAGGYGGGAGSFGSGYGAGGGGSFIFLESGATWAPLLIAGGGGGASAPQSKHGGAGGFSGDGVDAAPASSVHVAGATASAAGYIGGTSATFDGVTFVPGQGQAGTVNVGNGRGGGGGGYFGGAGARAGQDHFGGGGGSGYAHSGVSIQSETANLDADGFIAVTYANPDFTEATPALHSSSLVAGEAITLTGLIRQFDAAGDGGTLTFSAFLGTEQKFVQTVPVTTVGTGPFTASADVEFVPEVEGTYVFSLSYAGGTSHDDATAADVTSIVAAAPAPVPTVPAAPVDDPVAELAETGASASGVKVLGALGAGRLGAGAILSLVLEKLGSSSTPRLDRIVTS